MSGDPSQGNRFVGDAHGPVVQARDIHLHPAVHKELPAPDQLPPAGQFVDRADALAALDAAHGDGGRLGSAGVAVVTGPAGVGKTAAALAWALRARAAFPDGRLYADLRAHSADAHAQPFEVLGQFLWAFGMEPERIPGNLPERAALFRSLTADRRVLVLLDDALSAAQVRPLLPAAPGSMAIVTSRMRLGGLLAGGARGVVLDPLGEEAALELLRQALGPERVAAEPGDAVKLARLCAGLPLALRVAAARLAIRPAWPLRELVDALEHETERLSALTLESDEAMTIRAPLTLSYDALDEGPARLYRLLGLYPGTGFDSRVAAVLADVPRAEAKRLLAALADVSLLADLPAGRHRFPELTRLHARELAFRLDPPEVRDAALRRAASWFRYAVSAAGRAAAPYRTLPEPERVGEPLGWSGPAAALDWLDLEFRDMWAVARWAADAGMWRLVYELADAVWPLFLHRGHRAERLEFDRFALDAARRTGDREAAAKMLNRTGLALLALDRPAEAAEDFRAALVIWRELGVAHRVAGGLRRLGLTELALDDPGAAAERFREAAAAYGRLGEGRRRALALHDLGLALAEDGRPAEAYAPLRDALAATDDPHLEARVRTLLGRLGNDPAMVDDALRAMRELGSRSGEAAALRALRDLAEAAGDADTARRYAEEYDRVRATL